MANVAAKKKARITLIGSGPGVQDIKMLQRIEVRLQISGKSATLSIFDYRIFYFRS